MNGKGAWEPDAHAWNIPPRLRMFQRPEDPLSPAGGRRGWDPAKGMVLPGAPREGAAALEPNHRQAWERLPVIHGGSLKPTSRSYSKCNRC